MSLLMQSFLLGGLSCVGYLDSIFGTAMLRRPIVMGPLVGLIMGDLTNGIIIGSAIELVLLGAFQIGASNPPDVTSGGILGTAFAIASGQNVATAVTLAVPIATLVLVLQNAVYIFVLPIFCRRADKHALNANISGVVRMHIYSTLACSVPFAILVGFAFYVGTPVVNAILESIPKDIMTGMTIATGILPALGFAMLARMIINKKVFPYFFFGFLLAAYLKLPLVRIALFGLFLAIVLVNNEAKKQEVIDDNEF